jgi:hypothetical protein
MRTKRKIARPGLAAEEVQHLVEDVWLHADDIILAGFKCRIGA